MADNFTTFRTALESPGNNAIAVTPNNSADLSTHARGLYIGVAGDVKVTTAGGDSVVLKGAVAGSVIPVRVSRVWASQTTASSIVALY